MDRQHGVFSHYFEDSSLCYTALSLTPKCVIQCGALTREVKHSMESFISRISL